MEELGAGSCRPPQGAVTVPLAKAGDSSADGQLEAEQQCVKQTSVWTGHN